MEVGEVKKVVALAGKSTNTPIENLFNTFLKVLFLFIHPCFVNFFLLVQVILQVLKGYHASIAI
jgi:hypothetical protein